MPRTIFYIFLTVPQCVMLNRIHTMPLKPGVDFKEENGAWSTRNTASENGMLKFTPAQRIFQHSQGDQTKVVWDTLGQHLDQDVVLIMPQNYPVIDRVFYQAKGPNGMPTLWLLQVIHHQQYSK